MNIGSIQILQKAEYQRTAHLVKAVLAQNPSHASFLHGSLTTISNETLVEVEEYINYCAHAGLSIEEMAFAYNTIVMDTLREQMFFMRNRRYRYVSSPRRL